jgi:DNA repair exonuclease SbcCD ATPase subunit
VKILKLKINSVGGIRYKLELEPQEKNFLVYGPNGSGKSTIVNAIDFLLSGKISRMGGEGTEGIDFKKHGPHLDVLSKKESYVSALVQLPRIKDPIEIKRTFEHPNELIIDKKYKHAFKPITTLASQSQHILTKKEILKFVTSTARTRGDKINNLLKLEDLKKQLELLNTINNSFKKKLQTTEKTFNNSKITVGTIINKEEPSSADILLFVNNQRSFLGVEPISNLNSSLLKEGLSSPAVTTNEFNIKLVEQNIKKIGELISQDYLEDKLTELRLIISKIVSNLKLKESSQRLQLTRTGLTLLDNSGQCPLCNHIWNPEELKEQLYSQEKFYTEASNDLNSIKKIAQEMFDFVNKEITLLKGLIKAIEEWNLEDEFPEFKEWNQSLDSLCLILEELVKYPDPNLNFKEMEKLCAIKNLKSQIDELSLIVKEKSLETTTEQASWDLLTTLESDLKSFEKSQKDLKLAIYAHRRSEELYNSFFTAREKVLNELYDEITDRFVEIYKELHSIDEGNFDAKLSSKKKGVNLLVDFYGRGMYPPHAVHSEGHQDSMGICLYLALSEKITHGKIDLIILDDVMTTVDAPHRREISHLIANSFKDRQFLITTHDPIWAKQLQIEGVVSKKNMFKLTKWTIEAGPQLNEHVDSFEDIRKFIDDENVPAAAATLRRSSEEYFSSVCEYLRVETLHKEDRGHDLGELLNPAVSKYKELIEKAKESSSSWNKNEDLREFSKIIKKSNKIIERSKVEQWAVNPNVHYNNWANFTSNDFKPVVDAFEDLFTIFECDECGGMIHVLMNGYHSEAVRCNCGSVNWNLKIKE